MRRIKEILRLRYELGKSYREISEIYGMGKTTVHEYLLRASAAGLIWPLPAEMTEDDLEKRLFTNKPSMPGDTNAYDAVQEKEHIVRAPIPFRHFHEELMRPNVTMSILWEEYKKENPNGYQYSWFAEKMRRYSAALNYSMRQEHKAGEKCFVDFGDGIDIFDKATGKAIHTEIFVSVWGASKKTYAEAVLTENLATWIHINSNALEYFRCCPKAIVPDNLKAAVTTPCRYEPVINHVFQEFAEHYGTFIMPARVRKPKDKPLAENGVKLAKRWILARLRNRIFYSLAELNAAIREILADLNSRKMKKYGKSRDELFLSLDKPHALPLPDKPYEYAEWKKVRVGFNYHIGFEKHEYSVPYTCIRKEVEIKATANIVEVYLRGQRLCSHRRSYIAYAYTTVKDHMPRAHQQYIDWTPERILSWANKFGPAVKTLVEQIMNSKCFPEQAYKRCLGIIRLEKPFTAERLNLACERALKHNIESYRGVKNILDNGLENYKEPQVVSKAPLLHENIRGAKYFTQDLFSDDTEGEQKCIA